MSQHLAAPCDSFDRPEHVSIAARDVAECPRCGCDLVPGHGRLHVFGLEVARRVPRLIN